MDLQEAKKVINQVEGDYNLMVKEWNAHRDVPSPFQTSVVKNIKKGQKVLDVGCGNGVLYDIFASKSIDYTGMDISKKLLDVAKNRIRKIRRSGAKVKLIQGNILDKPLKNNKFDWVFAFAVLHHIPSKELQERTAREIYRVLKPGGAAVVSVWNLYSDYVEKKFKINEQIKNLPVRCQKNDILIPWKATPKRVIQRYFYRFSKKELENLFKSVGFKNVRVSYRLRAGEKSRNIKKAHDIFLTAKK